MSARGARSRKAVTKDIEKREKKADQKQKAVDPIRRPHDAFAEWTTTPSPARRDTSLPTRSITATDTSHGTSTSRSSSTNPSHGRTRLNNVTSHDSFEVPGLIRRRTSLSGSASVISDGSSQGKEKSKSKYKSHGKETKAPRGRGGGVPIKKPANPICPPTPAFRVETSASSYLPPGQKTWINFRTWDGGDSGLQAYGGFDCDEHMQDGTVLIYFKEEQVSEDRPTPQIRADLDVLENSGSTWLSNALLYGRIDENEDEWTMAGGPESSGPYHTLSPHDFPSPPGQRRMLSPVSPGGVSPPPFNIDQAYFGVPGHGTTSRAQYYTDMDRPGGTQSPPPFQQIARPQQPTHELWFTAPAHVKTPQGQRLHHVAIRNFLAMLHNRPIVGADLFEMLSTLQPEIQVMYDLDYDNNSRLTPRERSVEMITTYLRQHSLDDVRSGIKVVLGLLAWAEQDNVRWRQGYMESFVHLSGILSPQIEELPDFKRLSIATRRNLGFAAKALELRILEAEERLSSFDFNDLWAESPKASAGPVYQSYAAFRNFLFSYFSRVYGDWPPRQSKQSWLNRKIVRELQEDFGKLYDYLVNRDVVWDSREERPGKKWEMANKKSDDFNADVPGLSLTDMLVTFDNKHGYSHIPHPYPLLPRDVTASKAAPQKKGLFSSMKKSKTDVTKDAKAHLQLSIIFSDATNIDKMDVVFEGSTLIDQFERFELAADLKNATPREARLGRWILLYGILQVLSTISVDVQELKWTDGVRYFLCTDLKRCPDWVTAGQSDSLEASQLRSYCWQRPWGPTPIKSAPAELEGSSLPRGEELEGTNAIDSATTLDQDIQRISEKIEGMSRSGTMTRHAYERRIENEKIKQEEFGMTKRKDGSFRLMESDLVGQHHRPSIPTRNPMRSPISPVDQLQHHHHQHQHQQALGPRGFDFNGGDTWNRI